MQRLPLQDVNGQLITSLNKPARLAICGLPAPAQNAALQLQQACLTAVNQQLQAQLSGGGLLPAAVAAGVPATGPAEHQDDYYNEEDGYEDEYEDQYEQEEGEEDAGDEQMDGAEDEGGQQLGAAFQQVNQQPTLTQMLQHLNPLPGLTLQGITAAAGMPAPLLPMVHPLLQPQTLPMLQPALSGIQPQQLEQSSLSGLPLQQPLVQPGLGPLLQPLPLLPPASHPIGLSQTLDPQQQLLMLQQQQQQAMLMTQQQLLQQPMLMLQQQQQALRMAQPAALAQGQLLSGMPGLPPQTGFNLLNPSVTGQLLAANTAGLHAAATAAALAGRQGPAAGDADAAVEVGAEDVSWQQMLWDALHAAAPPSRFAVSGRLDSQLMPFMCPEVTVAGVGRLGLPLSCQQAEAVKAVAQQAPHGKGLRTVVDTAVRDAHQVDAPQVSLGSSWTPVLQRAVCEVSAALGLSDNGLINVEARLYKLLLYQQGGHFSAHQDTEKERGMIGTLVVQLPCAGGHTGGNLTIRHKGHSHVVRFDQESERSLQYAAFFADCEHELSPITTGMRLVLVYNLVWVGQPGAAPRLFTKSPAELQLKRALDAWEAELVADGKQDRIAILLEHQYTPANLRFEHLKGNDRAMARALATCPGIDAHLVLVTRTVEGGTSSPWDSHKRRRRNGWCAGFYNDSEEDEEWSEQERKHTMDEIYNTSTSTSKWVAVDGSQFDYDGIDEEEFYDPENNPLFGSDDEPDDENYEGYTGNAGPTLEYIYKRALLVMWPRSQSLAYAQRVGLPALLSVLKLRIADAVAVRNEVSSQQQQQHDNATDAIGNSGSSSSNSADVQKVNTHVSAALDACVKAVQQPQPAPPRYHFTPYGFNPMHNNSPSHAQNLTAVLQQSLLAAQLRVPGASEAVQQLVTAVSNSPGSLASQDLVAALAEATRALNSDILRLPLQQLVSTCMSSHPSSCISLITQVGSQHDLQQQLASTAVAATPASVSTAGALLSLAAAVPGLPAVQQQAVDKVAAAVQADASAGVADAVAAALHSMNGVRPAELQQQLAAAGPAAHLASCGAVLRALQEHPKQREEFVAAVAGALHSSSVSWQVSTAAKVLDALRDDKSLQQVLRAATTASVLSNPATLAAQTDESMLQLSALLLANSQSDTDWTQLDADHTAYEQFAAAVVQRPQSEALLTQMLQSEHVQAVTTAREQLVAAAAAAIRHRTSTWQAAAALQLSGVLQDAPVLQQRVQAAIAEGLFTKTLLLAEQTDDSMLQLSQMLLGNPQLKAAYYDHFAAAVTQRRESYGLLKQLLQSELVQAHLSLPEVQQLLSCQVANLERLSTVPPFSWRMPEAKITGYPQVEAFLRGPDQSFQLRGFTGINDARRAVSRLTQPGSQGWYSRSYGSTPANTSSYSFTATAQGIGRNAYVSISKTQDWHKRCVQAKEPYKRELQAVRALQCQVAGGSLVGAR